MSRPKLDKSIDPESFLNYYWLKEELFAFCKKYMIPRSGSKQELTERIHHYLKTGEILKPVRKTLPKNPRSTTPLTPDSVITDEYKTDQRHRAFFKNIIGEHFKFNVPFMNWMKNNQGKKYADAVKEWQRIYEEKKAGKKYTISAQFEYNQYTRDFFKANPTMTRSDAITCWKYKKALPGSNKYDDRDLEALNQ